MMKKKMLAGALAVVLTALTVCSPNLAKASTAPKMKVAKLSTTKIRVTWSATAGVDGYNIYRAKSSKGTYTKIAAVSSSALSYTNERLGKKSTYYYYVAPFNSEKTGIKELTKSNKAGINMKKTVSPEELKLSFKSTTVKRKNFAMLMVMLKKSCKGNLKQIKTFRVKSSKPKVASISKKYGIGLITGKRKGKTVITVTVILKSGLQKQLKATVKVK